MNEITHRDTLQVAAAFDKLSDEELGRAVRAALTEVAQTSGRNDTTADDDIDWPFPKFVMRVPSSEFRRAEKCRGPRMQIDMGAWRGICQRMGNLRGRNPDEVARGLIQNLKKAPSLREARLLIMVLNDALAERGASPELEALCKEAKQVLLEMDIGVKTAPEKE